MVKVKNNLLNAEMLIERKTEFINEMICITEAKLTCEAFCAILDMAFVNQNITFFVSDIINEDFNREYFVVGFTYPDGSISIGVSPKIVDVIKDERTFSGILKYELKRVFVHEFQHRTHVQKARGKLSFAANEDYKDYLSDHSEIDAFAQDIVIEMMENDSSESITLGLYLSEFECNHFVMKRLMKKVYCLLNDCTPIQETFLFHNNEDEYCHV